MGLFDAIVKTVVNVATLPVDVVKDVVTMGGDFLDENEDGKTYTRRKLEKIKEEAETD